LARLLCNASGRRGPPPSYTLSMVTGTVGFLSTFVFVRYIYATLKVD
jgi:hypothetical protein